MARKSLTGQLNMFDLWNNLEAPGEVQMVSLMPEDEPVEELEPMEEPEPVTEPVKVPESVLEPVVEKKLTPKKEKKISLQKESAPIMWRAYEVSGEKIEIAYLNYNKVRITRGNAVPELKLFESSKEAVDYYVEKIQELESDE